MEEFEKEQLKKSIEFHKKRLELVEKELELKKKLFEIADRNPQTLEPKYAYEKDKSYWETYKQLSEVLHEQELAQIEYEIERLKEVIDSKTKELYKEGGELNGE